MTSGLVWCPSAMTGYLSHTGARLGLLLNFKHAKLQWKRIVNRPPNIREIRVIRGCPRNALIYRVLQASTGALANNSG
jgi:hypothetical protein